MILKASQTTMFCYVTQPKPVNAVNAVGHYRKLAISVPSLKMPNSALAKDYKAVGVNMWYLTFG